MIDGSSSKRVEANSFDKDDFFTFWFYLINLWLPRAGVCVDNQDKANNKEEENISISRADKSSTGGVHIEQNLGRGGADVVKDSGISRRDKSEDLSTSGANKPGTGGADGEKDIGGVDAKKSQV